MQRRLAKNPEFLKVVKSNYGVPMSTFVDFAVVEGQSLTLKHIKTFKVEEGGGPNKLKAFVIEAMLERLQH
jgi:hypothetical protein